MRTTLAVADLIPGDITIPDGWEVTGYPHSHRGLSGTTVRLEKDTVVVHRFYPDSETPIRVLRPN